MKGASLYRLYRNELVREFGRVGFDLSQASKRQRDAIVSFQSARRPHQPLKPAVAAGNRREAANEPEMMLQRKGRCFCAPFAVSPKTSQHVYAAFSRSWASRGPSALSIRSANGVASNSRLLATALRSGKLVHKISCNRCASIS